VFTTINQDQYWRRPEKEAQWSNYPLSSQGQVFESSHCHEHQERENEKS